MSKAMSRLTPENEARISSALERAAALMTDGATPNAAIAKAAAAADLPAGHVQLMVAAYNNGRTLEQIEKSASPKDRAASFELADAATVLETVFPSRVKSAAEHVRETAVSAEYDAPPMFLQRLAEQRKSANLREKVAGAYEKTAASVPERPRYTERDARIHLSTLATVRQAEKTAAYNAITAGYAVLKALTQLSDYWRKPDAHNLGEVTANVKAACGDDGVRVLQHATSKQAQSVPKHPTHAVHWDKEPYSLVKTAMDAIRAFNIADAQRQEKVAAAAQAEEGLVRPFAQPTVPPVITGSVWAHQSRIEKQALTLTTALGMGVAGGAGKDLAANITPDTREELINKRLEEISTPEHEDKLRAIRLQAMIHEMMLGDPVISGYAPADVMDAYNNLAETAPRAMQQRIMAQALLRKYLEQASAMDPYDVSQMLNIEQSLQGRDMPAGLLRADVPTGSARELGMGTKPAPRPPSAPPSGPKRS